MSRRMALAATALLLATSSCRTSLLSPVGDTSGPATAVPGVAVVPGGGSEPRIADPADPTSLVPAITDLRSEVRHGTLVLTGHIEVPGDRSDVRYSPYEPGGWCLQVMVNTDQARTGYWLGYEYIVRGVEWNSRSHAAIVRRITLDDRYPGGWGPASGEAALRASRGSIAIAVPLDALGDDDGNLDFVIETYATVACPECATGVTHWYAAHYFGRCSADGRVTPASGAIASAHWPAQWAPPPSRTAAAAR